MPDSDTGVQRSKALKASWYLAGHFSVKFLIVKLSSFPNANGLNFILFSSMFRGVNYGADLLNPDVAGIYPIPTLTGSTDSHRI